MAPNSNNSREQAQLPLFGESTAAENTTTPPAETEQDKGTQVDPARRRLQEQAEDREDRDSNYPTW